MIIPHKIDDILDLRKYENSFLLYIIKILHYFALFIKIQLALGFTEESADKKYEIVSRNLKLIHWASCIESTLESNILNKMKRNVIESKESNQHL